MGFVKLYAHMARIRDVQRKNVGSRFVMSNCNFL